MKGKNSVGDDLSVATSLGDNLLGSTGDNLPNSTGDDSPHSTGGSFFRLRWGKLSNSTGDIKTF